MNKDQVDTTIASLEAMTKSELRELWGKLFGTVSYSHNRDFLTRRITWRLKNRLSGGLSERALKQAKAIGDDSLIRVRPKEYKKVEVKGKDEPIELYAGLTLRRRFSEKMYEIIVLEGLRFSYDGEIYPNLSAVAKAITGYKVSGYKFFNAKAPAKQ